MDTTASFNLTGRQAELLLREARLTANRNSIPRDPNGAWYTSGVRMGTPATTTLGMKQPEMKEIGSMIYDLLRDAESDIIEKTGLPSRAKAKVSSQVMHRIHSRVADVLQKFPLYPELALDAKCCLTRQ
jgi:glycine hydroxymethyltransferase